MNWYDVTSALLDPIHIGFCWEFDTDMNWVHRDTSRFVLVILFCYVKWWGLYQWGDIHHYFDETDLVREFHVLFCRFRKCYSFISKTMFFLVFNNTITNTRLGMVISCVWYWRKWNHDKNNVNTKALRNRESWSTHGRSKIVIFVPNDVYLITNKRTGVSIRV